MADLTRDDRRRNRKHVLDALKQETGSSGGSAAAAARVNAYRAHPLEASTVEFGFVGGLTLQRFYVDPDKPNKSERRSLWTNIVERLDKPDAANPDGWDGTTNVSQLQAIAEEAE